MAKLKSSERRLLMLFGVTLAVVVGLLGSTLLGKRQRELARQAQELELRWVEAETLIQERELWLARAEWLDRNHREFPGRQAADEAIFDLAKAVAYPGVRTFDHQFVEGFDGPHYSQAGVRLTAEGAMPDVMKWLYTLQRPDAFRAVRKLGIIPAPEDGGRIRCELELLQWYAPGGG